ncbi:unnamed protein product, partial [Didymodactylos carnosus]
MAVAIANNNLPIREDFRCAICRQKHVFRCEHDTKYRDQILGTYDSYMSFGNATTPRGSSQTGGRQKQTENNSASSKNPSTNTPTLSPSKGKGLENPKEKGLENQKGKGLENPKGKGLENPKGKGLENPKGKGLENPKGKGLENPKGKGLENPKG